MGENYVTIFPKVNTDYSLAIRNGEVVLGRSDLSDPYQIWNKVDNGDEYSDSEGQPAFALFNKATGQALMHASGPHQQLQLDEYHDPEHLTDAIMWTQSNDCGDDWRSLRMFNNTGLNVDAFQATEEDEFLDGTKLVVWEWAGGPNQLWMFNYSI